MASELRVKVDKGEYVPPPEGLYRFDRTAPMVPSIDDITDEHVEFYRAYGYLAIERFLEPDEVKAAIDALLSLIAGERPDFEWIQFEKWAGGDVLSLPAERRQDFVRKLYQFVEYDERLRHVSEHPKLLPLLTTLLGGKPALFQDMAMLKPPGGGREKPWHQDKAYFDLAVAEPVVGVWVALDEATAENGCMHVIPGSHRDGPVIHFMRRDWQICDTSVDVGHDVMVPLPPGGVLVFDGYIHHGTPPNRSPRRRRALQFHYAREGALKLTKEERMAIYGSEGKDVEC